MESDSYSPKTSRKTKTPEEALHRLMDLCARSEKCSSDARRSLYRWGVDPAAHDAIVDKLVSDRYIDNRRYARAYASEKSTFSGWGNYKIRAGLRAKQIAEDVIVDAISQLDNVMMGEKLEELLRRKMRSTRAKNRYDLRGKLLRFGTSRGFDFSQVSEVIDRLVVISDDDDFPYSNP